MLNNARMRTGRSWGERELSARQAVLRVRTRGEGSERAAQPGVHGTPVCVPTWL